MRKEISSSLFPDHAKEKEERKRKELELNNLIKELEGTGRVRIIYQEPYQDFINVDGQEIKLPFTNMGGFRVVLTKKDGDWTYSNRSSSDEGLRTILEVIKENEILI